MVPCSERRCCQVPVGQLSGDGPVMVAAEYRRKQDKENRHTMPG